LKRRNSTPTIHLGGHPGYTGCADEITPRPRTLPARNPLAPNIDLEPSCCDGDAPHEQLDDAGLLGRKKLRPERVELMQRRDGISLGCPKSGGLFDNLGRLVSIAGTFAAFMAGRWVAGLAAAALSVRELATALVFLRGALIPAPKGWS